tara:strand:- start:1266 stop:1394 length:129 start_codon:yes stop_codon:yes gene_type:complete
LSSPPFVYGDKYLGLKVAKVADGDITVERLEGMFHAVSELEV